MGAAESKGGGGGGGKKMTAAEEARAMAEEAMNQARMSDAEKGRKPPARPSSAEGKPKPEIDWDAIENPTEKKKEAVAAAKKSAAERAAERVGAPTKITSVAQLNFKHEKIKEVELFEASQRPGSSGGDGTDTAPEEPKKSVMDVIEKHQTEEKAFEDAIHAEEEADAEEARAELERIAEEERLAAEEAAAAAAAAAAEAQRILDEEAAMQKEREEAEALAAMDPLHFEVEFLNEFSEATGVGRWAKNDGWGDVDEATERFNTPTDVSKWFGITCAKGASEEDDGPTGARGAAKKKKKRKKKGPKKRGPARNLFLDINKLQGRLDRLDGWHRIASLEVLSLSHNKLQGPLPTEIVHLPSLKVLNLACNKFDGAVPEEWGSLKKLTHLWLFANQLTGPALPSSVATISGATALESLRLSRNKFTGQLSSGLGSLSRLEEIDLERNQLSGKLPDTLTRLTSLKKLWLAENNFRGPLPVDVLEALTSLKDLRFYGNKFDQWTASSGATMRTVSVPKSLDDFTPR